MNDTSLNTLDQVRAFLAGTSTVEFSFTTTAACYAWIEQTPIIGYLRSVCLAAKLPKSQTILSQNKYTTVSRPSYSTVTDFAKFLGWSTSVPLSTATW